jgi:hypothetical protein
MTSSLRLLSVLSVSLLTAAASAQGDTGFLRGKGRFASALSYTLDYYDEFWVGDNKVSDPNVGEIERATYSFYTAYGLNDDIDLVLNANYVEAESDGAAGFDDESALQDLYLGAKWRAFETGSGQEDAGNRGDFSFFFAPSIKLPMTDYEDNAVTAIGDGQVDLRFRAIAHYQIGGLWASLESGYDVRNGAPDDEVPVNLTLGGTVADRVTIMPFYSLVNSLGGIDISDVGVEPGGFPATEEEYTRWGISIYARIARNLGLTGMWRSTSDGMNTGDADAYSVGLVFGN